MVPLKRVVDINPETLAESTPPDHEFAYVDIGSVGRGRLVEEPTTVSFGDAPTRARRVLRSGDTIISTVRTYLRAVLPIRRDGLVGSTGFACLRPRDDIEPAFLGWWAQGDPFIEEVVARSVGVSYPAINPSEIGNMLLPVRPRSEQRAVAVFLDTETARIDALIATKLDLASALRSRFRAQLESVIAAGDGPLVALGRFVRSLGQGSSPQAGSSPAAPGEWGVLKLSAVKAGRFDPAENKTLGPDWRGDESLVPRVGDVLITRANTPDLVGDVCAVREPMQNLMISDLIYRLRLDGRLLPTYAAYALRTGDARHQLSSVARGSSQSMVKLRGEDLKHVRVPVPSVEQQVQVVAALDEAWQRTTGVLARLDHQVELLREHRGALITTAVTGELDVPGVAA